MGIFNTATKSFTKQDWADAYKLNKSKKIYTKLDYKQQRLR